MKTIIHTSSSLSLYTRDSFNHKCARKKNVPKLKWYVAIQQIFQIFYQKCMCFFATFSPSLPDSSENFSQIQSFIVNLYENRLIGVAYVLVFLSLMIIESILKINAV